MVKVVYFTFRGLFADNPRAIYEGLLNLLPADTTPDEHGVVPLMIKPGMAELPEISAEDW